MCWATGRGQAGGLSSEVEPVARRDSASIAAQGRAAHEQTTERGRSVWVLGAVAQSPLGMAYRRVNATTAVPPRMPFAHQTPKNL
jgi:hypothetical protein